MEADERGTLARLKQCRKEVVDPSITRHGGRMVKLMGDGALVEFPSVVEAVGWVSYITEDLAELRDELERGASRELAAGPTGPAPPLLA